MPCYLYLFYYFLTILATTSINACLLWNYEDCDNGNAMKQCNFQNNYGTIAYRKIL